MVTTNSQEPAEVEGGVVDFQEKTQKDSKSLQKVK